MTLPPPIPPGPHPTPWWCPTCGALECQWHHWTPAGGTRTPSAPPPIPPGREWGAARRRNRALAALARIGGGA